MRAVRKRAGIIALGILGAVGLGFACDNVIAVGLEPLRTEGWRSFAAWVSKLSDWPVLVPVLALASWIFRRRGKANLGQIFAAMALGAVLSGLTATTARSLTGRTRPSSESVQGFYGPVHQGRLLIGRHEYNSCPSGHTATAAGAGAALLFLGLRLGVAGMTFAVLVGWSRLLLNCHHFSDVVISLLIGVVGAACAWRVVLQWQPRTECKTRPATSVTGPSAV